MARLELLLTVLVSHRTATSVWTQQVPGQGPQLRAQARAAPGVL